VRVALNKSYHGRVTDAESAAIAEELMGNTLALRRLVRRQLRPRTPGPALRGAQLELLRVVEREPGIGVAAAARELYLAGNSVSTLVNQLADLGMLVREPDPQDRRAIRLRLTEAATQRLDRWRQARTEFVASGVGDLTPAQRRVLSQAMPVLRSLMASLEKSGQERAVVE
jgi:DNA-binding MarR family transcriptional regulator